MSDAGSEKFIDWVRRENVARYRDILENGTGARHGTLLKLLLDEERLLGATREQLNEVDRQIARIKRIIAQQVETVRMLSLSGHSTENAEASLARLGDLLVAHEEHRAKIEAAIR